MLCWDFKKCGHDKANGCPAYPTNGTKCWRIARTMCNGEIQGSFAQKFATCLRCDFYKFINNITALD
ncbi:MAG: two-CW domain-containing protein [Actinomycetota bacterium]